MRLRSYPDQICKGRTKSASIICPPGPNQLALSVPPDQIRGRTDFTVTPAPTNEDVAESRNVSPNVKENDANCGEEVKKLKRKLQEMRKEHKAEVERIRYIWKDKIYGEKTRAGKMLKLSLSNNT